jgi:hypothetical protein
MKIQAARRKAGSFSPVWLGEFGTGNNSSDIQNITAGSQGQWFSGLVQYLQNNSWLKEKGFLARFSVDSELSSHSCSYSRAEPERTSRFRKVAIIKCRQV